MPRGNKNDYDPKVVEYVKEHYLGITSNELSEMLKRDLGIDETPYRITLIRKKYGLRCGVDCTFKKGQVPKSKGKKMSPEQYEKCKKTMFKKGQRPHNDREIGSIYIDADGYTFVKVNNEIGTKKYERWIAKQQLVWEEHNKQKVPPGHLVIFADGNINNFDPNNLVLVTKKESLYLNMFNLRYNDCELTKTGLLIAKLKIAASDRSKKNDKR